MCAYTVGLCFYLVNRQETKSRRDDPEVATQLYYVMADEGGAGWRTNTYLYCMPLFSILHPNKCPLESSALVHLSWWQQRITHQLSWEKVTQALYKPRWKSTSKSRRVKGTLNPMSFLLFHLPSPQCKNPDRIPDWTKTCQGKALLAGAFIYLMRRHYGVKPE